jgi:hypothetical protein
MPSNYEQETPGLLAIARQMRARSEAMLRDVRALRAALESTYQVFPETPSDSGVPRRKEA